jgi:hypothetical protein
MIESVLYNHACGFRAKRQYKKGFELLKKGFERGDVFCTGELYDTYRNGGWGVEKNTTMTNFVKNSPQFKIAYDAHIEWSNQEPIITGSYSNCRVYLYYIQRMKKDNLSETDFNRHLIITRMFAKKTLDTIMIDQYRIFLKTKNLYDDNLVDDLFCYAAEQKRPFYMNGIRSIVFPVPFYQSRDIQPFTNV